MKRKWAIGLGLAAVAAVVAAAGLLPGDAADFAWGMAVGLGIASAISWFAERD